jgi:Ca2+:H+ antiporter
MSSSEYALLLEDGGHTSRRTLSTTRCIVNFMKGEDEPSWAESFRFFFFATWFNILLVFIPLSFMSYNLDWDVDLVFFFSFMAILPLAKVATTPICTSDSRKADIIVFSCWVRQRISCPSS